MRRVLSTAFVITTVVVVSAGPVSAKTKLKLTSPAFENRGTIPDGFTCDGANASPPLEWKGVPKGTVELAITLEDPDAPSGTFVHWVAWGIDPEAGALPEETLPPDVVEGSPSYFGPCPPPGVDPHRYRFTLYALDEPVDLEAGVATADDLRAAVKGTVKGKAKLVGLYGREVGTA
ncbi:MAG: YbhB/YbcL family Raf kinase inhibitor-like protein [Acidimicrobiia bacterium]